MWIQNQEKIRRFVASIISVFLGGVIATTCYAESTAFGPDIVGIQLGMSIDDVEEKLATKGFTITKSHKYQIAFTLNSKNYEYDIFTKRLDAQRTGKDGGYPQDYMVIEFSKPPNEARVIHVARSSKLEPTRLPLYKDYMQKVVAKYGEPNFQSKYDQNTFIWQIRQGKRDCEKILSASKFLDSNPNLLKVITPQSDCNGQLVMDVRKYPDGRMNPGINARLTDMSFGYRQSVEYLQYNQKLMEAAQADMRETAPEPEL